MSQQKDIHLTYDLHELEEQPSLKSEGIARHYITVSATDDKGHTVSITSNGEGEGRFHYTSNGACAVQDIGTIQARIKTTASAKRALREEYDTKRKFFPELFE